MVCAGIALILGTTSAGASFFGSGETVLQREERAAQPLGNSDPSDDNLDSQSASPIEEQPILEPTNTTPAPSTNRRNTSTNNSLGASTNLVEQITPPQNNQLADTPPATEPPADSPAGTPADDPDKEPDTDQPPDEQLIIPPPTQPPAE